MKKPTETEMTNPKTKQTKAMTTKDRNTDSNTATIAEVINIVELVTFCITKALLNNEPTEDKTQRPASQTPSQTRAEFWDSFESIDAYTNTDKNDVKALTEQLRNAQQFKDTFCAILRNGFKYNLATSFYDRELRIYKDENTETFTVRISQELQDTPKEIEDKAEKVIQIVETEIVKLSNRIDELNAPMK